MSLAPLPFALPGFSNPGLLLVARRVKALRLGMLVLALAALLPGARAATFYVATNGSDIATGSLAAPFKTLFKGEQAATAGDTVWLRGGTYRESLTLTKSGTAANPITFRAYSNEVVTLSGCDLVTNAWTFTSNSIHAANVGWDLGAGYNQVFVDGALQHEAQYPNWQPTNSLLNPPTVNVTVANNYTLTAAGFGTLSNASGARFLGSVGDSWSWQAGVITNHAGSTLTIDSAQHSTWWWPNQSSHASDPGRGFIFGKLNLLDTDGEWFHSGTQLHLRVTGGGSPSNSVVELKRRNWCVDINNRNYIKVIGLQTRAGAIRLNGTSNVLENCDVQFASHFLTFVGGWQVDGGRTEGSGVLLGGTGGTVRGCVIAHTAGSGIITTGTGHLVTRNEIYNIAYAGTYATPFALNGTNHVITFNTAHDTGRDVVRPTGQGLSILFNDLYGSDKLCKDGGILYTYDVNGQAPGGNRTRIAYNWCHDGNTNDPLSVGIYLDNYTLNYQVDHNVMWNFGPDKPNQRGIKMNSPGTNHFLYHNTLVDCGAYNLSTYGFTNLIYTAQNNLQLTNSALVNATLVNVPARDFRPKAGSLAVNPAFSTNTIAWNSPNGVINVPSYYSLYLIIPGQPFAYSEKAGQGVVLPGLNDGFSGSTPDSGAYEYGGPYWQPGVNGWTVEQPKIQTTCVTGLDLSGATLQGQLISAGLPSATVQVFWGLSDAGTNAGGWANQSTLGTNFTGSFTNLNQAIASLTANAVYYFRFRATNLNGESWGDALSFRVPGALTWDANAASPGAQDGSGNWNMTGTNWWDGLGNLAFTDGDSVTFGTAAGAAGTVTLTTNVTANRLTFHPPGSGSYIITNATTETLTLQSGGLTASNISATLALPPVLGASQSWTVGSGRTLTVGNGVTPLNLNGSTLTLDGAGAVIFAGGGTLGGGASTLTLGGARLDLGAGSATVPTLNITAAGSGNTLQNGSLTATILTATHPAGEAIVTANLLGSGGVNQSGAGTLTLSGANTFSGDTTINAGTLKLGANEVLPNGSGKGSVTVTGTLDLNAKTETVNGLNGAGLVTSGLAGTALLTVGDGNTSASFSGLLTDGAGLLRLRKTGSGTWTLSGANTFSGGVTNRGGTLSLSHSAALGTGPLTFATNSTLAITAPLTVSNTIALNAPATISLGANDLVLAGNLTGGATNAVLNPSGSGKLTLAGTNRVEVPAATPQTILVSAGTLELSGGGTWLSNVVIQAAGGNLLVSGGSNLLVGGVVNAAGITLGGSGRSLTMNGGVLRLSRFSMGYGGGTSVTLHMNGGQLDTVTFPQGGAFNFANGTGPADVTTLNLNGGVMLIASLLKGGGSAPAANNIVNLNGGTFKAGDTTGNFLDGGTLGLTVNIRTNGAFFDTAGFTVTVTNTLLNGGGGGGLTKLGAGTLTLGGGGGNAYTGLTLVSVGQLDLSKPAGVTAVGAGGLSVNSGATARLLAANQISDSADLLVNGTFNLNANSEIVDALSGAGTVDGGSGTPVLQLGAAGGAGVFAGIIRNTAGTLTLVKLGVGGQTLAGTNTYGGPTTVSNGTLIVTGATGAGATAVRAGATLAGTGTVGGATTVDAGGILSPGAPGLGTLSFNGSLTVNSGTVFLELNRTNAPATNDALVIAGALAVTTGTLTVTNLGPALVAGDSFKLLSKVTSGFTTVNLPLFPVNSGLAWTNRLAVDGTIAVVSLLPSTPTNLSFSVSGGSLNLSWPANYLGWILQSQTNTLNHGLLSATNAWFDWPGSASVTSTNLPINPVNPAVFYRLRHP